MQQTGHVVTGALTLVSNNAGVAGNIQLYRACRKQGVEPLPGVELYVTPDREAKVQGHNVHLTVAAYSETGYRIATSIDGRPIKVEGNPRHPASLGATDVFAEAAVLSLYNPDRSQVILNDGAIASRETFLLALRGQLTQIRQQNGSRLRLFRDGNPAILRPPP